MSEPTIEKTEMEAEAVPPPPFPESGSPKLKTYLGLSVVVLVGLVIASIYWWYQAAIRAQKAQQYDQVVQERDRFKNTLERERSALQNRFNDTLGESLGSSFSDAQSAAARKDYGQALHELDKIKPWLQLGENTHQNLEPVLRAWEEAHQALEALSPQAPQKVEALIQAAQELVPAKKL